MLPTQATCTPHSVTKSTDLRIWRCSPCKKNRNIKSDSFFSGQKLSFIEFVKLILYLSIKSMSTIAISQLMGISENTISDWKTELHTGVYGSLRDFTGVYEKWSGYLYTAK